MSETQELEHRLVAVLSADVVNYSALMAQDEIRTIRLLTIFRAEIEGRVRSHEGRVVDFVGDNEPVAKPGFRGTSNDHGGRLDWETDGLLSGSRTVALAVDRLRNCERVDQSGCRDLFDVVYQREQQPLNADLRPAA